MESGRTRATGAWTLRTFLAPTAIVNDLVGIGARDAEVEGTLAAGLPESCVPFSFFRVGSGGDIGFGDADAECRAGLDGYDPPHAAFTPMIFRLEYDVFRNYGETGGTVFRETWNSYAELRASDVVASTVPEPSTFALGAIGLLGLVGVARRRKP